jgi:predicted lipoprotein with Yx(FWY)xxD motif
MKRIIIGLAAVLAIGTAANAAEPAKTMGTSLGTILVGPNGMTLYTYAKDTKGADTSACTGNCIAAWPPFLAEEGAMAEGEWTIVNVTDKDGVTKKMWAYDGWPLYYWVKDTKPGDTTGENVGGVWHVVKAE